MRLKLLLPFYILTLFQTVAFSAKKELSEIKGKVLDDQGGPALTAVIQLMKSSDSTFVKGDVADNLGLFTFSGIKPGRYFVRISRVDLETHNSWNFNIADGAPYDLGTIKMNQATKNLKAVEVVAKKPLIQRMDDRLVFNVSEMATAVGSNALELLRKAPGVVMDRDNQLMLKGKTGVRIQINGKFVPLSVADLAAYLESIPAGDIEAIDIIENPSSKYDAAGTGGIINIRFKKNKNLGTNGSVNAGMNIGKEYPKYNAGIQLNHREKGLNFFGSYSNNTGRYWNYNNFYRTQNATIYDQKSEDRSRRQNNNYRVGADWTLNSKHTIGVLASGGYNEGLRNTESFTKIMDQATETWYQSLKASNEIESYRKNLNTNLNYQFKDTSGHQLNVDLDYGFFDNSSRSYQPNVYQTVEGEPIKESNYSNYAPTQIDITTAKADYEQTLLGGKFGTGFKSTRIKTDNLFEFYDIVDAVPVLNLTRSNRFVYTENVNAGYLNYSKILNKKWNFQAGLRGEQTNSVGDLTSAVPQNDQHVPRHYFNLFPSASVNFQQSENSAWNVSYSKRINRPNYQDLNPFENKIDELTYIKGNAFLRPQYAHSFSLGHTLFSMLNQSVGFTQTNDFFAQVTDTTEQTRAFLTQKNIATEQILSYNASSPFNITKWWSGYANLGVNHSRYRADLGQGKTVHLDVTTFNAYMQQTFKFSKTLSLEITGFYNSPSVWGGTFKTSRIYNVDIGVRKRFWGDKASFFVTMTDIFWGQQWTGSSSFPGLKIEGNGGWESRQLRFGFSYSFGNQQVKRQRNHQMGAETELNRVSK